MGIIPRLLHSIPVSPSQIGVTYPHDTDELWNIGAAGLFYWKTVRSNFTSTWSYWQRITTRCSEDDSVREHFDKLTNLREQLAAMGKSIPPGL